MLLEQSKVGSSSCSLVMNAGSSSLKHQLFAAIHGDVEWLSHGTIQRIREQLNTIGIDTRILDKHARQ
jgi:acetate kinase